MNTYSKLSQRFAAGARARDIGRQIGTLEQGVADEFNPHWGMLFRDRAELSAFFLEDLLTPTEPSIEIPVRRTAG